MKMARASKKEIDDMLEFHRELQEITDTRNGLRVDEKAVGKFVAENLKKTYGAMRVVFGFQVVQQVLDMDQDHLQLKPEYLRTRDQAESDEREIVMLRQDVANLRERLQKAEADLAISRESNARAHLAAEQVREALHKERLENTRLEVAYSDFVQKVWRIAGDQRGNTPELTIASVEDRMASVKELEAIVSRLKLEFKNNIALEYFGGQVLDMIEAAEAAKKETSK